METVAPASPWKLYQKFAFRFVFIFFILFIVLLDWSVNSILSYFYYEGYLAEFLDGVVNLTGKHLFHIPYTIISPYDGQHHDRVYIYLLYFIMAVASLAGALIWSVWDRKRAHYQTSYYWLTVMVRYYLAFTLFIFALEKFFKMQFPDPGYYTLTELVGELSPMGLAWAFFGSSYGYNIFMGIAESAALLLLFRRTTTLGALLTLATLSQVMVVNYSYDVHAKMYPTALFLMALFLLLKDVKRLIKFFFSGEAVSLPVIPAPVFKKPWMRISKGVLKVLVIGYFIVFPLMDYIGYRQESREREQAKLPLSGVYEVETFVNQQDTLSKDHPLHWKEIIIGDNLVEAARLNGDGIAHLYVSLPENEIIVSGDAKDLYTEMQLVYNELGIDIYPKMDSILIARQIESRLLFELVDSITLKLKGKIKNDSVFITAKRKPLDLKDFRLMKRRFHWITEAANMH